MSRVSRALADVESQIAAKEWEIECAETDEDRAELERELEALTDRQAHLEGDC